VSTLSRISGARCSRVEGRSRGKGQKKQSLGSIMMNPGPSNSCAHPRNTAGSHFIPKSEHPGPAKGEGIPSHPPGADYPVLVLTAKVPAHGRKSCFLKLLLPLPTIVGPSLPFYSSSPPFDFVSGTNRGNDNDSPTDSLGNFHVFSKPSFRQATASFR